MRSFKLNDENDIDFSNGTMHEIKDIDKVAQDIRVRLKTFYGEWFKNNKAGVKYREKILVKNPDLKDIEMHIRQIILETQDVLSILEYKQYLTNNKSNQSLNVDFTVNTTFGTLNLNEVLSI